MLEALPTRLDGVFLIRVPAFSDARGVFKESYARSKYRALGIEDDFLQDNVSFSRRGVIRGLHADPQMAKLVQVVNGEAFDVVVDARKNSPTFGKWESFHFQAQVHTQIYVPAGCLHGFLALADDTIFCYKQSAEYAPEREIGVRWDDPDLNIKWPLTGQPLLSAKDLQNRTFRDVFDA